MDVRLMILPFVLAAFSCGGTPATPSVSAEHAVLFVGNSLTQFNDLPARVEALARASGLDLETRQVVRGDTSLEDHWRDGRVRDMIAAGHWDFVVLQQGPSTLPESRANLLQWSGTYATAIRAAGGEPALLMVWPIPGQRQEDVAASYRAAAEGTGAVLIPAGEAWVRARAAVPGLTLTIEDGYHPSRAGTEIAALTVMCTLFPGSRPAPDLGLTAAQTSAVVAAACP